MVYAVCKTLAYAPSNYSLKVIVSADIASSDNWVVIIHWN